MDVIDNLRSDPPQERLFHYTNWENMFKIFTSRSLWATDVWYLNDTTEYTLAYDLVKAKWNDLDDLVGKTIGGTEFLFEFRHEFGKPPGSHAMSVLTEGVYVCSFSTKDNRIAWEAYGNHEIGYAIGFDYDDLIEPMRNQDFFLVQCQYDKNKHSEIIQAFLERAPGILKTSIASARVTHSPTESPIHQGAKTAAQQAYREFLQVAPMIKSPDWEGDQEWRLISKPTPRVPSTRIRRPPPASHMGGEEQVPYVEFKLQANDLPLRIPEVLIGGGLDRTLEDLNMSTIKGMTRTEIRSVNTSKVPYRPFFQISNSFHPLRRFHEQLLGKPT